MESSAMKLVLWALALMITATLGTPASAQNYPWCAQYGTGMGGMNCGFVSFAQCMATVRGIGGFCVVNTQYQPPAGPRPRHRNQS
jgi:hypothetical protein